MKRASLLWLALCGETGCVYYNAMWSAEHFAATARRAEARGSSAEARSWWARAAVKAESVVAQHPTSRWAPSALVLQGEGLARSGSCDRAVAPLTLALRTAPDEALRERAALAAAECALEAGDATGADRLLTPVTSSHDAGRRSRAAFLAGRAAQLVGDPTAAVAWYQRSADPGAGPARAGALLAAGRAADAAALLDALAGGPFRENDWAGLLDAFAQVQGADSAAHVLDRLAARPRVPTGARARLLLADGDRLLAAGRPEAAGARYALVAQLVPDSLEGRQARVRQVRALAARADSLPDLAAASAALSRLVRGGGAGAAAGEARALETLLRRVVNPEETAEGMQFRNAEAIRDSLGAPLLAGRLFLEFARQRPASLFTPKALVAAAALLPGARDSVVAVLNSRYADSPYTLALRGEHSPAFAAAEDSLARALGLGVATALEPRVASRVAAPVPGPRGPALDAPAPVALAATPAAPPARSRAPRDEPGRRPARPRPGTTPRDSL